MPALSPVSAPRANGVVGLTSYAGAVRTWTAILFVGLGVGSAACADHDVEVMNDLKTKICACTTASCAEQAMKGVPQGPVKSTPKMQEIARSMMDCFARLKDDERPSTDPDAAGSAGSAATGSAATGSAATGSASKP
jgi:hypothetical protein